MSHILQIIYLVLLIAIIWKCPFIIVRSANIIGDGVAQEKNRPIDLMVYKLYGLTPEEIKIVKNV